MAANVAISETDTATTGTSVARRFRRNANTTTITSSTARISVRSTSRSEVRMVVERSTASPMSMAGEIEALQLRHQRLHQIDGADDVGAGLPVEDDQDGRLAVGETGIAQIFDRRR